MLTFFSSLLLFILSFIIFFFILGETKIFGTVDIESIVEPVTYIGGLIGYALTFSLILTTLYFLILSYYFNLRNLIYFIIIVFIGLFGIAISFGIAFFVFDITNFFLVIRIPPFIPIEQACLNTDACFKIFDGLLYSSVIGLIIGPILFVLAFFYFKKIKNFSFNRLLD